MVHYGYLPQAHTDGDLYVHLRKANVLQRKLPALRGLPRLAKNAAEYRVARVDAHFDYGLNLLLEALERQR